MQVNFEKNPENDLAKGFGITPARFKELVNHFNSYVDKKGVGEPKINVIPDGIQVEIHSGNVGELIQAFVSPATTLEEFAFCALQAGAKIAALMHLGENMKSKLSRVADTDFLNNQNN